MNITLEINIKIKKSCKPNSIPKDKIEEYQIIMGQAASSSDIQVNK